MTTPVGLGLIGNFTIGTFSGLSIDIELNTAANSAVGVDVGMVAGTVVGMVVGIVLGTPGGVVLDTPVGAVLGILGGVVLGTPGGVVLGTPGGVVLGITVGVVEGATVGVVEGTTVGVVEGTAVGVVEGSFFTAFSTFGQREKETISCPCTYKWGISGPHTYVPSALEEVCPFIARLFRGNSGP